MEDFKLRLNPSPNSLRQVSTCGSSSFSPGALARRSDPEIGFRISFRRIGAGLANLGNTCFLNSVLQCLTYTEPFAAYLQSGKHKSSCRTSGFCALCALQNHVMDALQSTGKILRPFHLVKNLRCISRNFRNARQEDAHEYMVNLLESMHKCCLPSGITSESPTAYEKSFVHRIFGGNLRSQVKCLQCSFRSNKFDPFLDLSLEINKADNLYKALSHFTAVEQLDGGARQYQCQQCKQKVRAVKQLTIHKAPYVLTIHLKRFGTASIGQKIDKKIDFEPFLDLKRYVSGSNAGDLKYTLYGVLVHAGYATYSGHYYCFVRTSSGQWYSLNDHQVCQVSEKTVLQQKAYMLFYVRNINYTAKKEQSNACKDTRMPNSCKVLSASSTSVRLSSVENEKQSVKNNSVSAELGLLKVSETQLLPTKEPPSSVSPLSSLTSEDLVPDDLAQKPSSRGGSIQMIEEEDLMQTAQSKDKSPSLTSADQDHAIKPPQVGSFKPLQVGASEIISKECDKVEEVALRRSMQNLPNFRCMMFGAGRIIGYLNISGKKKRKRGSDHSCKRKRKCDLDDVGPSTSTETKAEPARKIHCSRTPSKNETSKGLETVGSASGNLGLTSPSDCSGKWGEDIENRKKQRKLSSSSGFIIHKKPRMDQIISGNKPFRINRGD